MNTNFKSAWFLALAFLVASAVPALAQYDDLYYDPSNDGTYYEDTYTDSYDGSNTTQPYDSNYDNEFYDYSNESEYEYSSRIRRFHRYNRSYFDYYDPYFADAGFYDPFYGPGTSIYVVNSNSYFGWRRANRWNRWDRFNTFGPSWGYNPWCSWNRPYNSWGNGWGNNGWGNTVVFNNYYYDPYWSYNGYNPYYCPPQGNNFVSNNYYYGNDRNTNGGYTPNTYTGVRRHGSTLSPGKVASNSDNGGRTVIRDYEPERKAPNGVGSDSQVVSAKQRDAAPTQRPIVDPSRRTPETVAIRDKAPSRQPTDVGTGRDTPTRDTRVSEPVRREDATMKVRGQNDTPTRREDVGTQVERPTRETRVSEPVRRTPETTPSRRETTTRQTERPTRTETRSQEPSRKQETRTSRRSNDGGSSATQPSRSSARKSRSSGGNSSAAPSRSSRSSRSSNSGASSSRSARSSSASQSRSSNSSRSAAKSSSSSRSSSSKSSSKASKSRRGN